MSRDSHSLQIPVSCCIHLDDIKVADAGLLVSGLVVPIENRGLGRRTFRDRYESEVLLVRCGKGGSILGGTENTLTEERLVDLLAVGLGDEHLGDWR